MQKNFTDISQFSHNLGENATPQQRCDRLINSGHLKGWERLFVHTLRDRKSISRRDEERLAAIESKIFSTAQNY